VSRPGFPPDITWVSGPWWCSGCGTVYPTAVSAGDEELRCVHCDTVLELEGTGDDDPYPEDAS
jgi:hypothetical protein